MKQNFKCNGFTFTAVILDGNEIQTIGENNIGMFQEQTTNTQFDFRNQITSVNQPSQSFVLKEIGSYSFYATKFTSIILPDSVIKIHDYVFPYTDLTEITFSSSLIAIGISSFELTIMGPLMKIRVSLFSPKTKLSITSVGLRIFPA